MTQDVLVPVRGVVAHVHAPDAPAAQEQRTLRTLCSQHAAERLCKVCSVSGCLSFSLSASPPALVCMCARVAAP